MRSGVELGPAPFEHVCAGIVDQDVEPAEFLRDRGRDAARGVLLAEIARRDQRLAARLDDLIGDLLQRLAPPAGERDRRAFARQRQRRRLTDAAAGAGHPGDFSRKIRHGGLQHQAGRVVDQVHVVEVRRHLQVGAHLRAGVRVDAPAHFRALDREEHHRLVAHRLDHFDAGIEGREVLRAVGLGLGEVLRADAEGEVLAGMAA